MAIIYKLIEALEHVLIASEDGGSFNDVDFPMLRSTLEEARGGKENSHLLTALEDLCGNGSQFEFTCDQTEHDNESGCVWCCARLAITRARGDQ